jgi:hypothetical protein
MQIEQVLTLLGRERIAGSPEEHEVLCTRIGELVRMNGEAWVTANRERLLREWEAIVRRRLIR